MKLNLMQHKTCRITYSNLCIREETQDISRLANSRVQPLLNGRNLVVSNKPHTARFAVAEIILILHTIATSFLLHKKKEIS